MTSGAFVRGKQVPNLSVETLNRGTVSLHAFRQHAHVALVVAPPGAETRLRDILDETAKQRKVWDWLGVEFLISAKAPSPLDAGVYLIDRYGIFIDRLDLGPDILAAIEKDVIAYESFHC